MTGKTVSFYLNEQVENELKEREREGGSRSLLINQDLERLYTLYKRALKRIPLQLNEAKLIADLLNATISDHFSANTLWAEIDDGIKFDRLDTKWEIDGPALIEKIKNLHEFDCMALIDAADRFWNRQNENIDEDDLIREVFVI